MNLERFASFWSAATGWGRFTQEARNGTVRFAVTTLYGKLAAKTVELAAGASGSKSSVTVGSQRVQHDVRRQGQRVVVIFAKR